MQILSLSNEETIIVKKKQLEILQLNFANFSYNTRIMLHTFVSMV